MKITKMTFLAIALFFAGIATAQTADEIIEGYFENTGGKDAWKNLEGVKMTASINQQGMEIPITMVQMSGGKSYMSFSLQGTTIKQNVFNGETLWSTNFQTMKPEKSDTEMTENAKKDANDFPDPFLDYEDKGYEVELMGKETMDGAETYKIKLVKEPKMINGEEVEDVSFYYFDAEAYVPLAVETEIKQGPAAGQVQRVTMSDYQEVDGLYFPFSMTQGVKDGPTQPINISEIETNPEVSEEEFAFPEQ